MGISLTDILLREVNAERSDAYLVRMSTHGLLQIPKSDDIVAYLVLDGEIKLETKSTLKLLRAGDYALMFYGNAHRVYGDARRPAGKAALIMTWPAGDEPVELKVGQGRERARFICAALRLIHNPTRAHWENPLDDIFRLAGDADDIFQGGVFVTDLGQVESACRRPGANAFVNHLMNLHLTHAIRCGSLQLEYAFRELSKAPYLMSSEKSRAVATAIRLLRTHPEKNWTVANLAREVGLSRSTFAAMFSSTAGRGPMELLNQVRMERAQELLTEHGLNLPLLSIASRVGYASGSSFSRAFKAHYGVSPRALSKLGTPAG